MENLNNLPPFYAGQKVVYITGKHMPKNSIHTIKSCFRSECGCWGVLINKEEYHIINTGSFSCTVCGNDFSKLSNGWKAESFRPAQEQIMKLVSYSKVLKEQPISVN